MPERPLGGLRHVDLALLEPRDQIVGGEVDDLDVVGPVDDRIRHRLAHPDAGDLGDDVVQALDVLDVQRGVDVDAGREQLLDVLPALGVPALGRVGMGELVDQGELRAAGQQRVEVHLLEGLALVGDAPPGDHLEAFDERLGLLAAVRLDDADDHVDARRAASRGPRSASRRSCRPRAPRRGRS